MWSKVYTVLLVLSVVVMAFFTYYSFSWLQSIGLPVAATAGYEYHSSLSWNSLWISAIALLFLGNVILWTSGQAWALWTTFVYFAVAVVVRTFWLDQAFADFRMTNNYSDGIFTIGPVFAVILIGLMGIIVFFNQFIVVQLNRKMYPPPVVEEPELPMDPAKDETL